MPEREDLTRKQLLAMPVSAESGLLPLEKETSLNLLGSERAFTVYSRHPTCIRGLLRQPEFVPELAVIVRQRGRETIVGIKGRLPVACVHIGAARKRHFLSQVFARRPPRGGHRIAHRGRTQRAENPANSASPASMGRSRRGSTEALRIASGRRDDPDTGG